MLCLFVGIYMYLPFERHGFRLFTRVGHDERLQAFYWAGLTAEFRSSHSEGA